MPEVPTWLRIFSRGSRVAEDANLARDAPRAAPHEPVTPTRAAAPPRPETVAPLHTPSAAPNEVLATRTYRQGALAAHEAAPTGTLRPGASPDEVAATRRSLDQHVADRSAIRTGEDVSPTKPKTPQDPLVSRQTKGNLARAGLYTGLGLGGLAGLTAIGGWAQQSFFTPLSQNKVNEANAQTPKVDTAGVCAKIVTAPGQSTLLDDAECRAAQMRQFLRDPQFGDAYRQFFLNLDGGPSPGSVNVKPVTTPPPTFADKAMKVALAAVVLTLTGAAGYGAWRYYKAHPEKFRKKAGSPVANPARSKSPPAGAPA
jgi:hypothetical protein